MQCFYSIESPTLEKYIHEARGIAKSVMIRKLVNDIARDLYKIITSHKDLDPVYDKDFNTNFDGYVDPIYEVVYNHNIPWNWEASTDDMKELARKYPEIEFVLCTAVADTKIEYREFFLGDKCHLSNSFLLFEKSPDWSMTEYDDEI